MKGIMDSVTGVRFTMDSIKVEPSTYKERRKKGFRHEARAKITVSLTNKKGDVYTFPDSKMLCEGDTLTVQFKDPLEEPVKLENVV